MVVYFGDGFEVQIYFDSGFFSCPTAECTWNCALQFESCSS